MHVMVPSAESAPFIHSCLALEREAELGLGGGVAMVFNLGGAVDVCLPGREPVRMTGHFLIGGLGRRVSFRSCGPVRLCCVRFRPCGIFPFLSMPQMEFAGECVALEEIWELMGLGVAGVVRDRGLTPHEYAHAFDDFFALRRMWFCARSPQVVAAVSAIRRDAGMIGVEALAAECGVSRRQLERQFDRRIGVSPKHLARIFRLSNALHHLPLSGVADTAARCGFFDQSHLIRDCRDLIGTPPGEIKEEEKFPLCVCMSHLSKTPSP